MKYKEKCSSEAAKRLDDNTRAMDLWATASQFRSARLKRGEVVNTRPGDEITIDKMIVNDDGGGYYRAQ